MSRSPLDGDQSKIERLRAWWLQLPLSYRVNTLLYMLGALTLVVLLVNLLSGDDDPRQTQVAAGVSATTTTFRGLGVVTTRPTPTSITATTVSGMTTTTLSGSTPAIPSGGGGGARGPQTYGGGGTFSGGGGGGTFDGGGTTGGGGGGTGGGDDGGSGGGGGGGDGGGGGSSNPTLPPEPPNSTTPTAPCRNSTEVRCGFFHWDPPPPNQYPTIGPMTMTPASPRAGQTVKIDVTVSEGDHGLNNACATLKWGDGTSSGSCPQPPCITNRYGPWDPPSRPPGGTRTFTFEHVYANPGSFSILFEVESRDECRDPYGTVHGSISKPGTVVIAPSS